MPSLGRSKLLAHCRLVRLPNVFTAIADVLLGWWLVHPDGSVAPALGLLIAASCLLYSSGMVWNDVFDLPVDRVERPQRPLPSGAVSLRTAILLASALTVGGVLLAATVSFSALVVAMLLVACILGYDSFLKQTPAGPLGMGACRFLNVALGMSTATVLGDREVWFRTEFPGTVWLFPLANGVYIAGVTWFSRQEATRSSRPLLALGAAVITLGLCTQAAGLALVALEWQLALLCWAALLLSLLTRLASALRDPAPDTVQRAVKTCLLGLILIDSVGVLGMQGIAPAVAVALLLAPALVVGQWVYST